MVFIMLLFVSAALTFTELGFAGIGSEGNYIAYVVVLLQPVAVAALFFGARLGGLLGLLSGVILYAHSIVMPLNFYEMMFVTPFTSIVMLPLSGLMLGGLFGKALRNDPPLPRRVIYISLICLFVSFFYSFNFVVGAFGSLVRYAISLAETVGDKEQISAFLEQDASTLFAGLGDMTLQSTIDAVLMVLFSLPGDTVARWAAKAKDEVNLRTLFNAWLLAVMSLVFMVSSALGFVAITRSERIDAFDDMSSEVAYLCKQLANSDKKDDSLLDFLESVGVDFDEITEDDTMTLAESLSIDNLLDGYTEEEDGLVLVLYRTPLGEVAEDGTLEPVADEGKEETGGLGPTEPWLIAMADKEGYDPYCEIDTHLDHEVIVAIDESLKTGEMERIAFNSGVTAVIKLEDAMNKTINSEVAFLYAKRVNDYVVTVIRPASMVFAKRGEAATWTTMTALVLLFAVYMMVSRLLGQVVVRHINDTNDVLSRITDGDLDARVEMGGTTEFRSLATGINDTVGALKGWIAEAETRMDAELATAKAIQEAALPSTFPPFPDIMHFDIYASMHPAKEVGGDFYDFFLIGEDSGSERGKLGFVIADV
ncbi:MAG: hypothetical protein Q3963_09055, partial [Coriobacteriaceae bacterium]|nr:hypothetical protein [Coriobacteriaceae bacterium]